MDKGEEFRKMEQDLPLEFLKLNKRKIEIVQINLGNKCNQTCYHCHVEGSPSGKRNMDDSTAQKIHKALIKSNITNIEFTGGAPEINPNLKFFIEGLSKYGKQLTVRTNLTILEFPGYSFYSDLYKKYRVHVVASLPSIFQEVTDRQRGKGVFHASVKILKKLNEMGYGTNGLLLDLVYNPVEDNLPPEQIPLEEEYKELLREHYGISFSRLIPLVNCPVTRFKNFLIKQGKYDHYMKLLKKNYNPKTLETMMCRNLISIDDKGHLYDCDFNLAVGMSIKGHDNNKFWEIDVDHFAPEIALGEHCYACTINQGSH
jgi:radical SAM/Cys-rich protein